MTYSILLNFNGLHCALKRLGDSSARVCTRAPVCTRVVTSIHKALPHMFSPFVPTQLLQFLSCEERTLRAMRLRAHSLESLDCFPLYLQSLPQCLTHSR